jgi:chlorobactene glucosyltransferase
MRLKNWSNIISLFSISTSVAGIITVRKAINDTLKQTNISASLPQELVSVVVPAKNEQDIIAKCVKAVLEQEYNNLEIIIANDNSTDDTAKILDELKNDRMQVLEIQPPASSWTGKANALWQAYKHTDVRARWILFLDADTILEKNAIKDALHYAKSNNLDLLSLAGSPIWQNVWTPLLMPEIFKFYTIAHNNPIQPAKKNSVEAASAIGTFILVQRTAYEAVGGHGAVKSSIIEDIELAKTFRRHGFKTEQISAPEYLKTLWYESFLELWEGVTKNMFAVADKKWSRILFLLIIEWIYGLVPILILAKRLSKRDISISTSNFLNYLSVVLIFGCHNEINKGLKIPSKYSLGYPVAAIISSIITLSSAIKMQTGKKISWKGREIEL